jgi:tRNA (adenine22-N1)-methyltransferase
MKKLDPRLLLVADFVDQDCVMADIGTDHAYLPVYLVEQGHISSAIASDLREGPLSHAKETVENAQVGEQVELRLSDGLENIQSHEVDCVVMAGMGGILISQLIEHAPWLQDQTKTLVLQPMTDAPLLRSFLAENGFEIVKERATGDKKHCYTVIKAVYSGKCATLTP